MNDLIKLDAPEFTGIEQSKAAQIKAVFQPMSEMLFDFEEKCNEIFAAADTEITEDLCKKAKRLRIDIGKVRINTEKTRKDQKEEYLRAGKAIDGVANILKWAITEKENKLEEIEKHFEKMESLRIENLQLERAAALAKYTDEVENDLGTMKDYVWMAYIESKEKQYNDRIEAERKAEEERIENERLEKLENERHLKILPYRQFWTCDQYSLRTMSETNFETICNDLVSAKAEYEKKQAEIAAENERLKKEAEEKERIRKEEEKKRLEKEAAERKEREETAKKEREAYEAEMRKIREEAAKKIAEREKAEREEREKLQAAEQELAAKKAEEARLKAEEEARIQSELNKGDSDKVKDLKSDLESLKSKYSFKSVKNQKMYSDVGNLIDKIIAHIG